MMGCEISWLSSPATSQANYAISGNSADVPQISVNGTELAFSFNPVVLSDGDYAVVGEARNGFYSMLRLYHEWDRFTEDGVLTLKSFDEHTYVFKVNSKTVLVDGVEKPLGFTFTLRDGLPVFQIKKFLDVLGYKYTFVGADVEITAVSEKEAQELDSKVENWWEFNDAASATEGFTAQQGVLSLTNDGYLAFAAGNGTDVAVLRKVDLDASKYEKIIVGMEYNELLLSETSQLFFTTSTNTGLSADKVIYGKADMNGKKTGDTVEITFNLSNNHMFAGNVTLIRFDPYSGNKDFKIDYVRCIKKGYNYKSENSVALTERKINLATDLAGLGAEIISCDESKLEAISLSTDPNFTIKGIGFDTSEVSKIHVRMSSTTASVMQVYFATDSDGALSENKSARADVKVSDEMVDYYINVSANPLWKGRIVSLRFDPVMTKDTRFVIEMIELVK